MTSMLDDSKYLKQVYKDLLHTRLASSLDTTEEAFKEFEDVYNKCAPTEPVHEVHRDALRFFYMTDRPAFERWMSETRSRHLSLWADCGLAARVLGLDGIVYLRWNQESKRYEAKAHQKCNETIAALKAEAEANALQRKRYQAPRRALNRERREERNVERAERNVERAERPAREQNGERTARRGGRREKPQQE